MGEDTGFFYLNIANQWPSFELHQVEIVTDGSLALAQTNGQYAKRGVILAGPFQTAATRTEWFRLRACADRLPHGAHVQLFTYTADAGPAPFLPDTDTPFADPDWHQAPRDLCDILIPNPPKRFLWVGLLLRGPGNASPSVRQMRIDYGRDTYLPFLPALYAANPQGRDVLERLLALYATALGGVEQEIDDLPLLFDPTAAPFPEWLDWLNGWLAFRRSERWTESESRQCLAEAFELYGWRGTIEGLKRYLKMYAGVEVRIEEPGRYAALWSLGEVSTLGFTTMLAPSPLQGAVVGSSATLDESRLDHAGDGASLFEDIAHRFCVQVYCAQLNYPGALETVQAVLEREKPAHTVYELCTIDARMRVGWQARVGIDAIIAPGPPPAHIGMRLGGTALAGAAEPCDKEA